jgi:hypothetical protein
MGTCCGLVPGSRMRPCAGHEHRGDAGAVLWGDRLLDTIAATDIQALQHSTVAEGSVGGDDHGPAGAGAFGDQFVEPEKIAFRKLVATGGAVMRAGRQRNQPAPTAGGPTAPGRHRLPHET